MKTFKKDPDAVLDYDWDWTEWLGNDTIDSFSVIVPTGMTLADATQADGVVKAWLSGGVAKTSYVVTCQITTLGGRTDERSALFNVQER
jgi:hypothetical protein